MTKPIIESLESEIKITKINAEENMKLADKYNVMSLPTAIIFEDNKEIARLTGVFSREAIEEYL